ncbi:MAG TPA: hypothetical protein VFR50_09465 [Casimicrobiaceae bacterium]|nr:hypothetical protein [Casimicrobiaceae bacterium]
MSGRGAGAAPRFGAHGRSALVALTVLLASCANLPTPVMPADEYDPEIYEPAPAPSTPLVESPPVEPVEPLALAPPPQPSPAPAPSAPAASPPSSAAPTIVIAPAPATEPTDDQQMLTLLADLQRYNNLPNDELKREITSATQALARQRNDVNRIRLAVLYTLLRASPQDDQRALQLFENVAKNAPATSPVRQLAAILQAQVVERQRAVRDEQQKADAAIQKLEALRAMERSLLRDRVRSGGGGGGAGGSAGGSGR